jgi:hypothetical protein
MPTMVRNGAIVSVENLEYHGWVAQLRLIGIWAHENQNLQEEDQVQDEGEDRYLIFGKIKLAVAPFLINSTEIAGSTLSGIVLICRFA